MADDTLVGKNLGQYEILSLLGRGLFSAVYRAYQASLNRTVALKVLPADFLRETDFMARFEQEVRLLMQLEHFHILPLYDIGEADKRPFLVMRYMPGGTLGNLLARYGRLAVAESVPIIQQVAAALDYAHGRGILHRNFKPSNILLDEEGTTYISDFSIGAVRDAITIVTGSGITGGIAYAAPEQLGGGRKITPAVDVYALAAILYHMVTGRLPFQAENAVETAKLILSAQPAAPRAINPDIPPQVEAVIMKGLAKEPAERFPMSGALARALSIAAGVTTDSVKRGLPPADDSGIRRMPPRPPSGPLTPPPGSLKAPGAAQPPSRAQLEEDDQPTPSPQPAAPAPTGLRSSATPLPGSLRVPSMRTPPPGAITPPPGRIPGGHSTGTDSSLTPLLRTPTPPPAATGSSTGSMRWQNLSDKERKQLERARRQRARRSGGGRWTTWILALILVLVAWFFVGIYAGLQLRADQADRELAAIHANETVAAATAFDQATQTADAMIPVVVPTEETQETTQAPTETAVIAPTNTPTRRAPTSTPSPVPSDTATPQPTLTGGTQGLIAYVSEEDGDPEINLLELATGDRRQITRNNVLDGSPVWSPDGSLLAFESAEAPQGQHIYVVNADGSERREITRGIRVDSSPIWSPTENLLAFHSFEATRSYIRTIGVDGSNEDAILQIPPGINHLLDWSVDGEFITYFGFSPAGTQEIIELNIATGARVPLTRLNGGVDFLNYSPDRSLIVFTRFVTSTRRQVYLADNDPSCDVITDCNTRRLTNDAFNYLTPRFSPDGALILAASNRQGGLDLYLIDLEGNIIEQITDSRFDDYDAVWQPAPAQ